LLFQRGAGDCGHSIARVIADCIVCALKRRAQALDLVGSLLNKFNIFVALARSRSTMSLSLVTRCAPISCAR
jgi:hypothetical protein